MAIPFEVISLTHCEIVCGLYCSHVPVAIFQSDLKVRLLTRRVTLNSELW